MSEREAPELEIQKRDTAYLREHPEEITEDDLEAFPHFLNNLDYNIARILLRAPADPFDEAIRASLEGVGFDQEIFLQLRNKVEELGEKFARSFNGLDATPLNEEAQEALESEGEIIEVQLRRLTLPVYKAMRRRGFSHNELVA